LDEFYVTVKAYDPDVVSVTERWAHKDVFDSELAIPGYHLFRCNRPVSYKGGGVLLYVKAELQVVELEMKNTFPEQIWCCIGKKGKMRCQLVLAIEPRWRRFMILISILN